MLVQLKRKADVQQELQLGNLVALLKSSNYFLKELKKVAKSDLFYFLLHN